jgi:hypothetical protein
VVSGISSKLIDERSSKFSSWTELSKVSFSAFLFAAWLFLSCSRTSDVSKKLFVFVLVDSAVDVSTLDTTFDTTFDGMFDKTFDKTFGWNC